MFHDIYNRFSLICLSLMTLPVQAMTPVMVPTEPIYYEPPVVVAPDEVRLYSCYELDSAIRQLHPYQYSYKPNFSEDGSNKLAASLIIFDSIPVVEGWLGLAYLGYSSLIDEKEVRRTELVEQKIAMLQRVKSEKHCYE